MNPVFLLQPNALMRSFYPRAIWHRDRTEKCIYLTFDDGPVPVQTEWVLEELKKFEAKATFFCVGENVSKHPAIFESILKEGHQVANHTMHHVKGFKHGLSGYLKEVDDCRQLVDSKLFRPPYGQLKRSQYRALLKKDYEIVFWDVISYDYEKISKEQCLHNVMSGTGPGSIVLFHDSPKAEQNLKFALPVLLKSFSEQGYTFKSLS